MDVRAEGARAREQRSSSRGGGAVMAKRAERRGGEAKAMAGRDELGEATHGELPSSIRKSRQK
jgi:hypothetical protein